MSTLNIPIVPVTSLVSVCAESRVNLLTDKQTRRITLQVYEATQELLSLGGASDYAQLLEDAFAELVDSPFFEKEYGQVKGMSIARMQKLVLFLTAMEATDDCIFEQVEKNRTAAWAAPRCESERKEVSHVSA